VAGLAAGRHLLLEGPPGTGKSTLLRAVAEARGVPFLFVEGTSELTPARLVGAHDPAAVLRHGYRDVDFVPGPLVEAMRGGALLYVEELNRAPEDTLNVLLGPLAEGTVVVPRLGPVDAEPGFRLVAAMNPFDRVGTTRVSQSVNDRLLRLPVGYQTAAEEAAVVRGRSSSAPSFLVESAVWMARATRQHPDVAMGASVRGAIDLVVVAGQLAALRGVPLTPGDNDALDIILDAALCALSGRIVCSEVSARPPEAIIVELWEDHFYFRHRPATATERLAAELESAVHLRRHDAPPRPGRRPPVGAAPAVPDRSAFRPAPLSEAPRVLTARHLRSGTSAPAGGATGGALVPAGDQPDADLAEALLDLAAQGGDGERAGWDAATRELDATELRELTRRLALRIVLRLARPGRATRSGRGMMRSVRYRFNSDDLDLDRTIEEIVGKAVPEYDDFWVRERVKPPRTFALMIDASGSMRGASLLHAAVAAAALARALTDDDYALVMFWRDAAVLKHAGQERLLPALVDDVLAVRARGLTNLRLGLECGLRELHRSRAPVKEGILFTDALHNLGDDPGPIAQRFPRLHVVGTSLVPDRVAACRSLATRGRGECSFIGSLADIPAAISRCLSG
jgi:Mg-chelatase subunit ChlI